MSQSQVLPSGFGYHGRVYRSLAVVARAVTGSHCRGHLFFGLTGPGPKPAGAKTAAAAARGHRAEQPMSKARDGKLLTILSVMVNAGRHWDSGRAAETLDSEHRRRPGVMGHRQARGSGRPRRNGWAWR